jgi:protein SCO1/2
VGLFLIFAVGVGCGPSQKHYVLRGRVMAKSADQLTVKQEDISGFMSAMVMPYAVKDAEALKALQPGDLITADLVVSGKSDHWLEHVVVIAGARETLSTSTDTTEIEIENGLSLIGTEAPNVPLMNQDGKTTHLTDFKGQVVLLTFIYTRCPFPTFCPLLSSEFAAIQRALLKTPHLYGQTHLVSVTLDPGYDTATQLRKYGLTYLRDDPKGFSHWDFVSTSPEDLRSLAAAFGLTYFGQNDLITHSMRTILIASNGTIVKIWDGSEWRLAELMDAMQTAAIGH